VEKASKARLGKLALAFGVSLVCLVILEGAARVLWTVAYNQWLEGQLHGYDHVDKKKSVTVMTPGYATTYRELLQSLQANDKPLGVQNLIADGEKFGIKPDEPIFQINSFGFKGPEISKRKAPGITRIMTIGDSVTFGPYMDVQSYPRWLARELGPGAEVINAGHLGYNLRGVLERLDYFLEFEPDIVTVLIGWNHTIARADPRKWDWWYRYSACYRFFYHGIINRADVDIRDVLDRQMKPYEADDAVIHKLEKTNFDDDFEDWAKLAGAIRARKPSTRIVALTLPGLLVEGQMPDEQSIRMAHPVAFTNNLYAWPVLTRVYNKRLRQFAADHRIEMIDLATWSIAAMKPRSQYFVDSVHMSSEGYELTGRYLAQEFLKRGYLH
jgi:lysophospholipase L1-like esterase